LNINPNRRQNEHVPENIPGVIERIFYIFWSRSGSKCALSVKAGIFIFQYNSSLNRWTQTHILQSTPGGSLNNRRFGLIESSVQEAFSPNGLYLLVHKGGSYYYPGSHYVYDLAAKKYIGPFFSKGKLFGWAWTSDSRHVVSLVQLQEDHGPFALHTFSVEKATELPIRTFMPSTSSFDSFALAEAYFVPAMKEPSSVSCRHPDLKTFAEDWLDRDSYVFFEPAGNRFLMVSSRGNFSLYQFSVLDNSTVDVQHVAYRKSFIPKGCSPPIRSVQWTKGGPIIFAEHNVRGTQKHDLTEINPFIQGGPVNLNSTLKSTH